MDLQHSTPFATQQHGLAQYLILRKRRAAVRIDLHDNRPVFEFETTADLERDITDYNAGALVPAPDFAHAGNILRSLLVAARRAEHIRRQHRPVSFAVDTTSAGAQ